MIGKLFSSKKVVEGVTKSVDAAFFTSEEKSQWFERLLKLYEPYKLAQRILAIVFCVPWALLWTTAGILVITGNDISHIMPLLGGQMGTIVFTIVAFYFGGGAVEGMIKAARK